MDNWFVKFSLDKISADQETPTKAINYNNTASSLSSLKTHKCFFTFLAAKYIEKIHSSHLTQLRGADVTVWIQVSTVSEWEPGIAAATISFSSHKIWIIIRHTQVLFTWWVRYSSHSCLLVTIPIQLITNPGARALSQQSPLSLDLRLLVHPSAQLWHRACRPLGFILVGCQKRVLCLN